MGDLGHFDEKGVLHFDGRLREQIRCKNNYVSPQELDTIIQAHPDVLECGVFGMPDGNAKELVSAAVKVTPDSTLTEEDVRNLVKDAGVAEHKWIQGPVVILKGDVNLPRNGSGKIMRRKLSSLAR